MQQPARDDAWLLTDGHAGNLRQAQALADALGVAARAVTLTPRAPWRWLAPRSLPGAAHAFGEQFEAALRNVPQLVIGCGRQGALATRLARARGARAVQVLDPRLRASHWDVVVVPQHDGLRGGNVITLQGSLHPVDDAWLAAARARFASLAEDPAPRTALLVGGPGPHFRLEDRAFADALAALRASTRAEGGSLWVTASRRTPDPWRVAIAQGAGAGRAWCGAGDGHNPYAGFLAHAQRIVCTADSVNMLSEAAATQAPVFVLGRARLSGRPRRFVDALVAGGRVRDAEDGLTGFAVTPLRETARVAGEVARRLGVGRG